MKHALLLLILVAGLAHATGTEKKGPTGKNQAQAQTQAQTQTQQLSPTINAAGGAGGLGGAATGGAGGTANATGGVGEAAQSVAGDTSDYRSLGLFLPPLAWTPPMAPIVGCAPEITQSAFGIAWGLFSQASSRTDPGDCVLVNMRNSLIERCQFASAKQIDDLMVTKKLPEFKAAMVEMHDYTVKECALLKSPPPPAPVVNYVAKKPKPAVKPDPCKKVVNICDTKGKK